MGAHILLLLQQQPIIRGRQQRPCLQQPPPPRHDNDRNVHTICVSSTPRPLAAPAVLTLLAGNAFASQHFSYLLDGGAGGGDALGELLEHHDPRLVELFFQETPLLALRVKSRGRLVN